jgi:hypothetical protein
VRVQNTYFILQGNDAAREHLRRLPLKTISTTICRCWRSQPFRMCRTFECLR